MLGATFKPRPSVAVHDFFQEKEGEAEKLSKISISEIRMGFGGRVRFKGQLVKSAGKGGATLKESADVYVLAKLWWQFFGSLTFRTERVRISMFFALMRKAAKTFAYT